MSLSGETYSPDSLGFYQPIPRPHPRGTRRGNNRVGAVGLAKARWRDFDRHCGAADYAEAVEAARDAIRLEDDAGVQLRPIIREMLTGGPNVAKE